MNLPMLRILSVLSCVCNYASYLCCLSYVYYLCILPRAPIIFWPSIPGIRILPIFFLSYLSYLCFYLPYLSSQSYKLDVFSYSFYLVYRVYLVYFVHCICHINLSCWLVPALAVFALSLSVLLFFVLSVCNWSNFSNPLNLLDHNQHGNPI